MSVTSREKIVREKGQGEFGLLTMSEARQEERQLTPEKKSRKSPCSLPIALRRAIRFSAGSGTLGPPSFSLAPLTSSPTFRHPRVSGRRAARYAVSATRRTSEIAAGAA